MRKRDISNPKPKRLRDRRKKALAEKAQRRWQGKERKRTRRMEGSL